jgi:hypothetical protein
MRTSQKIAAAATLGTAAAAALLAASLGASEHKATPPDPNDPVVFVKSFYAKVLSGESGACDTFTAAGRRDFVKDMHPAQDCGEAVQVLGNAVGPDHLFEFTRSHTYVLMSREEDAAVVRADFGETADLMDLRWIDGQWRVGKTTPTSTPLVIE